MEEIENKAKKDALYISLVYVGLGTISLLAIASPTLMEIEFVSILFWLILLLTMPVSFIGFGILYGEGKEGMGYALLTQVIVFVIFWFITYRILLGKEKKRLNAIKRKTERSTNAQQDL
ncbi:hypothetical protein [Rufibacter roseus]|uniref:Uncharacterized protein n=1 Tax=Rufibacter roseus TaxID=1567108 RepID=A0ABW2DRI9_9BACT|nr:hypothetical protein [Rufibacter roseus]